MDSSSDILAQVSTLNEVLNLLLEFIVVIGVMAMVAMEATVLVRISAIWGRLHLPWPFDSGIILDL